MKRSDLRSTCRAAIKANARILGTPEPYLLLRGSEVFKTRSTRAALAEDGSYIIINIDQELDVRSIWFAVSHEMRHLWQMQNNCIRKVYSPSSGLPLSEYNEQPEEIDAHAWAVVVMKNVFGVRPTLDVNLGETVWKKIEDQANKIENEMKGIK